jgi:hypothetical protein
MSTVIPTIEGKRIYAGYAWGDLEQVHLSEGEIPPLTTAQFLGYAATALSDGVIPNLASDLKREWAVDFSNVKEELDALPDRPRSAEYYGQARQDITNDFDAAASGSPEDRVLFYDGYAASRRVDEAEYRSQSPFDVSPDGQVVGFKKDGEVLHTIGSDYFISFVSYALAGGTGGWGEAGTYPEVRLAANSILNAFQPQ